MPSSSLQTNKALKNSLLCFENLFQSFTNLDGVCNIYAGSKISMPTLQLRLSSIFRLVTAFNTTNGPLYEVTLWAYVVIVGHWITDWLTYNAVTGDIAVYRSIIIDVGGLLWMASMWSFYTV